MAAGIISRKISWLLAPQPNEEAKDAYFFVTDLKGSYYYARTLSEHSANCQKAAQVNKTVNTEK